jgi:hypothetical protein
MEGDRDSAQGTVSDPERMSSVVRMLKSKEQGRAGQKSVRRRQGLRRKEKNKKRRENNEKKTWGMWKWRARRVKVMGERNRKGIIGKIGGTTHAWKC